MISYRELGLVNTREMFEKAYQGRFAIPAFNFVCMEQLLAIVDACVEKKSPFILQASAKTCRTMGIGYVRHLAQASAEKVRETYPESGFALNLDHGLSYEDCRMCIENGFSSVMIDGSAHTFEKNIALTKKVAEYAHAHGVSVEGELGVLSGTEGEVSMEHSAYTDPDAVCEFVDKTGVDSLAVSIGSCHGTVKMVLQEDGTLPKLRFDILEEIERKRKGYPIVLHGSSCLYKEYVEQINLCGGQLGQIQGIPEEEVARAAEMAVCKINVASDGWIAATAAVRKALYDNRESIDPRVFLNAAREEMRKLYSRKIERVMGSAGRW